MASVAPDDVLDAVTGQDAAHTVRGVGDGSTLPLLLAASALRRAGASAATLAMPAAGDPVGIGGPRDFTEAAVDAGEAALFPGARLGLVPSVVGGGVSWQAYPAGAGATVPDVAGAERELREALLAASQQVHEIESPRGRAETTAALCALRIPRTALLPQSYSARAERLAALALRCTTIVELAPGRQPALVHLERAARHALVAAASETPQQRARADR